MVRLFISSRIIYFLLLFLIIGIECGFADDLTSRQYPDDSSKIYQQKETIQNHKFHLLETFKDSAFYFPEIEKFRDSVMFNKGPVTILNEIILDCDSSLQTGFLNRFLGKPLTPTMVKEIQTELFDQLTQNAYLNTHLTDLSYQLSRMNEDSLFISMKIDLKMGERVKISSVSFWGNKHISSEYLRRVINASPPFWYSPRQVEKYKRSLRKIEYIDVSNETFINKRDSIYELIFKVTEGKLINFDFLVGYQPVKKGSLNATESNWSGHVLFNFKNLFGSGRRLFIEWDRPKQVSEELNISYREPYLFGLPFHLEGGYRRLIEDSLFNVSEKRIKSMFPWNDFYLNFEYSVKNATNDSLLTSIDQPLRVKTTLTGMEMNYDSRENRVNPEKGMNMNLRLFTGEYDDDGSDSSFTSTRIAKIEAEALLVLPIKKPFCLLLQGQGKYVNSSRTKVPVSEQYFIGGSSTMRGYRDRQFLSEVFTGGRVEARFLFSSQSRFHFFIDGGVIKGTENNQREWLTAYGAGFLIPVRLGLMEFDYGIPKGSNFNQGILHFRLINTF